MNEAAANKALQNYLASIQARDKAPASLDRRREFLERIIALMARASPEAFSPAMYRIAVARVLPQFAVGPQAMLFKATAREFSHYLADAEGSRNGIGETDSAPAPEIEIDAPDTLEKLLEDAAARAWYVTHLGRLQRQVRDLRNLERYMQNLRERGVSARLVERQGRLLGGLLSLLAPHHGNALAYRAGVSAVLNILSADANQQKAFVEIAREFYYYWLQDPDDPRDPAVAKERGAAVSSAR